MKTSGASEDKETVGLSLDGPPAKSPPEPNTDDAGVKAFQVTSPTEEDSDSDQSEPAEFIARRIRGGNVLSEGIPVVSRGDLPLEILPDSERLNELLPGKVDIDIGHLFFVNRDESMKKLLRFHFWLYTNRHASEEGGPMKVYPLLDSLYGMGKSHFAHRYLCLVAKFVRDIVGSDGEEGYKRITEMFCDTEGFYGHLPFNKSCAHENLKGLLGQLMRARTLKIRLNWGSLAGLNSHQSEEKIMTLISFMVETKWNVSLPKCSNLLEFFSKIPKPVFVVFDEIGAAFESQNGDDIIQPRKEFLFFLRGVCDDMADTEGMFYLLCGRASFLHYVGGRPEAQALEPPNGSPARIYRIPMNPIREENLALILENTTKHNAPLSQSYPGMPLEQVKKLLYTRTGGHPRFLQDCLQNGLYSNKFTGTLLSDVRELVKLYPDAIRALYNDRNNPNIDLEEMVQLHDGRLVSRGFIASRIHAGIGMDTHHSNLSIIPPIAEYLDGYFKPFLWDTLAVSRLLKDSKFDVDKSRIFQRLIVSWFQSMFCEGRTTFEVKLGEFCPSRSLIANTRWLLDPKKFREGRQVLGFGTSQSPTTITEEDLARQIRLNFANQEIHGYLPPKLSASVDIIISPQILDEGGNPLALQNVLIGIQVKCMSAKPALGRKSVLAEAKKFADLVNAVNNDGTPSVVSRAVFIMCCTCEYTQTDFQELKRHHAIIWNNQEESIQNIEVIILNLATPALREEFFSRVIPPGDRQLNPGCVGTSDAMEFILKVVEDLIRLN